MEHWTLLELFTRLHEDALRQRAAQPVPPATSGLWSGIRRRLARKLVGAGLRLDADASRAVIRTIESTPRLNGSDA